MVEDMWSWRRDKGWGGKRGRGPALGQDRASPSVACSLQPCPPPTALHFPVAHMLLIQEWSHPLMMSQSFPEGPHLCKSPYQEPSFRSASFWGTFQIQIIVFLNKNPKIPLGCCFLSFETETAAEDGKPLVGVQA